MVRAAATEDDREIEAIVHWHEQQMVRLGVPAEHATLMAFDGVDWHEVEELLLKMCPPDLVVEILS